MHVGVGQAAGDLPLGQRVARLGIEHREDGIVAVEGVLLLRLIARTTAPEFISEPVAAIVSTEAKGTPQAARPLEDDLPRITVVEQPGGDELCRRSPNRRPRSQQEVDALLAPSHGLAQCLDRRVGPSAQNSVQVFRLLEGTHDLVVDAVAAALLPPKVIMRCLSAGISSPSRAICPFPKTSFVGLQ